MPYKIKYQEETSFILVEVEGKLDLLTLKGIAADVAQVAQAQGCTCILNDLRKARPTEDALAIFSMPKMAKQAGVDLVFKRALVVGDKASDFYFLETVFVNKGHQVKMFADLEDAKEWLLGY